MPEPDDCERTGRRRQRRSTWGDLLAKPGAWREARYCLRAARLGEAERPGPPQSQTNTLDRYLQLPAAPASDLREVEATAPAAPEAPPPPPDSCGGAAPGAAAQPQAQQPLRDFTAACWATLDELDLLEEFKLDCPTLRYVPKSARAATADATEELCRAVLRAPQDKQPARGTRLEAPSAWGAPPLPGSAAAPRRPPQRR